jgi:hypothetical protein
VQAGAGRGRGGDVISLAASATDVDASVAHQTFAPVGVGVN